MKRFLFLLIIAAFACNEPIDKKVSEPKMSQEEVETLEKKGFELFQNEPAKANTVFQKVALEYEQLGNFKKAGITNLNIANIYDERLNKLDSALIFSKKSLAIWQSQNDTLQMANLHKYIGLLHGKLGSFEKAKSAINEALSLYEEVGFEQGIAVSQINLADVYFRADKFHESEKYLKIANAFWESKGDKGRIFANNLLGIELYQKMGDKEKLEAVIQENQKIDKEIELNAFVKEKFEELLNK